MEVEILKTFHCLTIIFFLYFGTTEVRHLKAEYASVQFQVALMDLLKQIHLRGGGVVCVIFVFNFLYFAVITCWERADLLALWYIIFTCVFVTFPYGVLGQLWYLIVSIPDLCPLPFFYSEGFGFFFRLFVNHKTTLFIRYISR